MPPQARARLRSNLAAAVHHSRRGGERLAAVSWRVWGSVDPSAVVFASRRPGEPWICFEQPDRDGAALGGIGAAVTIEERGPGRFERAGARWRSLAANACAEPPQGPPGSGVLAAGGFAFADDGAGSLHWSAFAAASLIVPEVTIARRGDELWCTVAALARPGDSADALEARIEQRLSSLRERPLPLLDPHPTARHRIGGALAPEHYEAAVARAVEQIAAGKIEKIVLAREVEVHAPREHDVAAVFDVLRGAFAGCFVFAVGRGAASFIAASPELLIRREGLRASTLALAGSIARSNDPAVDEHLGERLLHSRKEIREHAIVVERIERALRPHSVWVTKPDAPQVARIANIQHLATPIRAQLAGPVAAIELAGLLHPTPAVGAEPPSALPLIAALEGIDRGWYAGPVGWSDANGDGEFCVALRCALVEGKLARCYAGVGVVADSDPAAELAETEVKLGALLPVLS
ncbi:MAG: isochorismate synthase [Solirubrobacteraceae bacterium]|jgi:salicylate biosynthesis isochorismate synthase/menaquinone-specific isochorismate synthase